jgi:hypothetical protein
MNNEQKAELARLELECAKIVSSVHGVIPAAMANRLEELRDMLINAAVAAIADEQGDSEFYWPSNER